MFSKSVTDMIVLGVFETLYMTFLSTIIAYLLGLPLGVILTITDNDGLYPIALVNRVLGFIVNVTRSIPFLILLIAIIPFTRLIAGSSIGSTAAIVPLVIASAPFVARLVESSLKEVNSGVIEAAKSMGASNFQIIYKVMLPEARPALIVGSAIAVTTILSYSAMAGIVGGGGLGAIAINYGYYRYQMGIMLVAVILLVVIVQVLQEIGTKAAKISDKRI